MSDREGWQAEKVQSQRVYHYIRDTFSLCGKLGFYRGDVIADNPEQRTKADCRACIKKLDRHLARTYGETPK